jgi:MFS family permease
MRYWKDEFSTGHMKDGQLDISAAEDSLIVSILSAGTFFGALFAAPMGDLLGRRWGLMLSAGVVFNMGVIMQTASTSQPLFIAGRFFAGLGVGLISALSKFTFLASAFVPRVITVSYTVIICLTIPSSHVPVRNCTKVDSWHHCRRLSARYHDWIVFSSHCEQRHQRPL